MILLVAVLCMLLAVVGGLWISAERDVIDLGRKLAESESDLRVALAWETPEQARKAVVLHAIDGGKS